MEAFMLGSTMRSSIIATLRRANRRA